VWSLREEYWQTVLVEVKEVTSVFGAGDVTRRANSAAAAARRRLEAIERLEGAMKFGNHVDTLKILTHRGAYVTKGSVVPAVALLRRLRATERQRINDFRSSAANALRVTAYEVDKLFADVDDEPGRDTTGSSEPTDKPTKTMTDRRP
jgi:hypothetical protein